MSDRLFVADYRFRDTAKDGILCYLDDIHYQMYSSGIIINLLGGFSCQYFNWEIELKRKV
jgi:hypothetical protein